MKFGFHKVQRISLLAEELLISLDHGSPTHGLSVCITRPATWPTVTGVALYHINFGTPCKRRVIFHGVSIRSMSIKRIGPFSI
jgi:hypothetical protein